MKIYVAMKDASALKPLQPVNVENVQPETKVGFLEELCEGTMPLLGARGGSG